MLESTYPVVARLVDGRFFRYAAHEYICAEPPAGPCLFEYGATLANFLESFEPFGTWRTCPTWRGWSGR